MSDERPSMAPGSVVVVRDGQWLVTSAEQADGVWRVEAQGLTELVRNSTAVFFGDLDPIEVLDPRDAKLHSVSGRQLPARPAQDCVASSYSSPSSLPARTTGSKTLTPPGPTNRGQTTVSTRISGSWR
jgi:hypothetical protein